MKQLKNLLSVVIVLLFFAGSAYPQGTTITLIHVNDSHSHLDASAPRDNNLNGTIGGISRAASVIGYLKATEPNPLFFHTGDFSVGDFFFNSYFGVPELQILQSLGCDGMVVGNHEFDLGPSTLEEVYAAEFTNGSIPVVSANLDMSGYPSLSNFISSHTIKTVSGVKVGIFGLTIPDPLSNPSPVVINENIPEIAFATIAEMKSLGAEVVICLSHLGYTLDSTLAANIPGINVIIGAHDHYAFAQPKQVMSPGGTVTYICQAGCNYEYVGELKFTYYNGNVTLNSGQLIPVTNQTPPVSEIEAILSQLKQGIVAQFGNVYNSKIGTTVKDIGKNTPENSSKKDSPIGNLVTDAYRYKTGTSIAITANGLMADIIHHGPVVGTDVFRTVCYGFDTETGLGFNLVKFKMNGNELIKGLEIGLSMIGISDDFFPQVSGIKFKYNPENPPGERVIIASVKVDGERIQPNKKYSVTANNGLLGILISMGVKAENIQVTNKAEYTALKDFISHLKNVNYKSEGRIKNVSAICSDIDEEAEPVGEIKTFKLYNNYPNPFNPSTTIKFEIPYSETVTLKIYNSLGQEVAKLTDGRLTAGTYEFRWNASDFSSGVYFYQLQAGNFIETKKMILVR
jgi:5'-nucleotidase